MLDKNKHLVSEITTFSGFFADDDTIFLVAKAKLKRAVRELRRDKNLVAHLGMDPKVQGRPAITRKATEHVWDYLSFRDSR